MNGGTLLLGTNHAGCGDYDIGMRAFWRVSSVGFGSRMNSRCTQVNATQMPLEDAMDQFELDFGHYEEPLQQRAQRSSLRRRDDLIASDETVDITDDPDALADFFGEPITQTYPDVPEATPADYNGTVTPIEKRVMLQRRSFWSWISNAVEVSIVLSVHSFAEANVNMLSYRLLQVPSLVL